MTDPERRGDPACRPYYTYIVRCKHGTYYAGWSADLKERIAAHNNGTGAKYLRGKGPVTLVYKKKYSTARKARAQERFIKSLTRKEKESVIARNERSE